METSIGIQKRSELLEKLIARAWSDELFKARLMKNSAKAVEEELGINVPDFIKVKVVEETADTRYIVMPYRPIADDELLDEELEAVAAGSNSSGSGTENCEAGGC